MKIYDTIINYFFNIIILYFLFSVVFIVQLMKILRDWNVLIKLNFNTTTSSKKYDYYVHLAMPTLFIDDYFFWSISH